VIFLDDKDQQRFLKKRRKGDLLKMELAAELRKQTAMSMGWIARELNSGAPNSAQNGMRSLRERGAVGNRECYLKMWD
jgi:hypothetical protein